MQLKHLKQILILTLVYIYRKELKSHSVCLKGFPPKTDSIQQQILNFFVERIDIKISKRENSRYLALLKKIRATKTSIKQHKKRIH